MDDKINWTWNGPINGSARLMDFGASHVATLSLTYPPNADACRTIGDRAAREVAEVLLDVAPDGPAVERYRRLITALANAEARGVLLTNRLCVLRHEQEGAGSDDDPDLAARLVAVAREIRDKETERVAAVEEVAALGPSLKRARAEAEEDLARRARQQSDAACRKLEARRAALLAEVLEEIGDRLTALLALDESILRARSGAMLRPLLDRIPATASPGREPAAVG
jgi:hypothetical protein